MKKINSFILVLLSAGFVFAESSGDIYLPNLETVIEDDSGIQKADFDVSLETDYELPSTSGDVHIVLPDFEFEASEKETDEIFANEEKSIYSEGQIGAGYPGFFKGDFSIYRMTGADPFKINFKHESVDGYSLHPYSDGYNDSSTLIDVTKTFAYKNLLLTLGGDYKALQNGLQSKSDLITSINQQKYAGDVDFLWALENDFSLDFGFDLAVYNRFAEMVKPDSSRSVNELIRSVQIFDFSPAFSVLWGKQNGLNAYFNACYNLQSGPEEYKNNSDDNNSNRGQFNLGIAWKNEDINLFADVGLVVGNMIGINPVIVPFKVGMDASFPVTFSNRKLSMKLQGGCDSYQPDVAEKEMEYRFSCLNLMPSETTDWYGQIEFNIPVKTAFTLDLFAEYRTTAFENGVWNPVYEDASFTDGCYLYSCESRNLIHSEANLSFTYKLLTVSGGWISYWDYVPALEQEQAISLDFSLQSQKGNWGATISSQMCLSSNDFVPVVDAEAFVKISSQVRLSCEINDAIKLVSGKERVFAGDYIERSGTASLLVKFFF